MRVRAHLRAGTGAAVAAIAIVAIAGATIAGRSANAAPAHASAPRVSTQSSTAPRLWWRHSAQWHRRHGPRSRRASAVKARRHRSAIEIVLATARAQVGKPYVYGAAGPNAFDCSGLTKFVWGAAGVRLPHNAAAQYGSVRHVPLGKLRPGDLIFFGTRGIGHVGIYIGAGLMIHAPHTGTSVEISPLRPNTVGAGRPGA